MRSQISSSGSRLATIDGILGATGVQPHPNHTAVVGVQKSRDEVYPICYYINPMMVPGLCIEQSMSRS